MDEVLTLTLFTSGFSDSLSYSVYAETEFIDNYEVFTIPKVTKVGIDFVDKHTGEKLRIAVSHEGIPFAINAKGKFAQLSTIPCLIDNDKYDRHMRAVRR
ncbi:hypothetical protein [Serratia marcescens]|uniref:hypothetical protein n=1 Tax=Serratia marcescens TaxID=615 RepID=UPI003204F332